MNPLVLLPSTTVRRPHHLQHTCILLLFYCTQNVSLQNLSPKVQKYIKTLSENWKWCTIFWNSTFISIEKLKTWGGVYFENRRRCCSCGRRKRKPEWRLHCANAWHICNPFPIIILEMTMIMVVVVAIECLKKLSLSRVVSIPPANATFPPSYLPTSLGRPWPNPLLVFASSECSLRD